MDFLTLIISEFNRRIYVENTPKIIKCLDLLTEDQVWQQPNDNLTSIGNLILHLNGNVRQWIGALDPMYTDIRQRPKEFLQTSKISKKELVNILQDLQSFTDSILSKTDPSILSKKHTVQCYEETGFSIIVHVIEHFSYHVGQISFYTKTLLDIDLGFYGDVILS